MKMEFSRQCFEKYSNVKSRENLSSGGRVVPCGQTDMTKLIVAFRNFANAPTKTVITFTNIFIVVYMEFINIFFSKRVPDNVHVGRKL
jgi:hypothetical protein